ncbi:hypothetical protein FSPOR_2468 [Fusarium sporotrichioides]|uniref:Uncharacterized protein n=1 Tax=Fusarium sporotrichioides TaxID=5514 RepID=A0A395SL91_FUSSP|nr:hypothetical protein FSPOR_2468 [Fusarium sporotrichioides]
MSSSIQRTYDTSMTNLMSYFVLSFGLIGLVKSLDTGSGSDSICGYINGGTASNGYTVECIDDSLPACATYTWPGLWAKGYFCAPSRTTVTVIAETASGGETTSTIEPPATADPSDASSAPLPMPTETEARPTLTATASGHPQPTDDGGPNLGTEHDLSSRQRIGAGVGSGVSGGLLLVFFACCDMAFELIQSLKAISVRDDGEWTITRED